jgi:hypothetical protein
MKKIALEKIASDKEFSGGMRVFVKTKTTQKTLTNQLAECES